MLSPTKNPLYVTLMQGEQVARVHHKTVERLQKEGVRFAGPFYNWHEVLLWKVAVWMEMFTTGQAEERAEDERNRCDICGGRENIHTIECPRSDMSDFSNNYPADLPEDVKE